MFNYLRASTTFGAAYKTYILWDAQVETTTYLDKKKQLRPLFMGEKMMAFTGGMIYSPLLAPWWFSMFVDHLDMYRHGKSPYDCGYTTERKTFADYIFM